MTLPVSGTGSVSVPAIMAGNVGNTDSSGNTKTINPSATASLTLTGYYQSTSSTDNPPRDVILEVQTTAKASGFTSDSNGYIVPVTGTVSDGFLDTPDSSGLASGTHYRLETVSGGSFTFTLSPNASVSTTSGPNYHHTTTDSGGTYTLYGIGSCSGSASVGSITFSIVKGNWDGPYYLHYGSYYNTENGSPIPWANNTAGPTPTYTDVADKNSSFSFESTTTDRAGLYGSITPIWYWDGPDLGMAPPPFLISINAEAYCVDYNGAPSTSTVYNQLNEYDSVTDSNSERSTGYETAPVSVQSDAYMPGQGNGYWAVGPTINLGADVNSSAPYHSLGEVDISVWIQDGYNGG